jgi:general secretion pathway protein L
MAALLEDRGVRRRSPLDWWLDELRGLLPRRDARPAGRSRAVILLDDGAVMRAAFWRRGRVVQIGSLDPSLLMLRGADGDPVLQRIRRARLPVVLRLPAHSGLLCRDILPASAEPDLDGIMRHKIDVLTPWTAEQVYAAPSLDRRRADGTIAVRLAVVPRDVVDAACARLEALGVTAASVDLAGDPPWAAPEVDLLGGQAPGRRSLRLGAALLLTLAIVMSVGAAFAWSEIHARSVTLDDRRAFATAIEQRLADLPKLRQEIDQLRKTESFVAREIEAQPSATVVVEVASRVLPDSVWLTGLTLDGDRLTLTGYAPDASKLVPMLDASSAFTDVHFEAPSTTVATSGADGRPAELERFAVTAKVLPYRELGP